MLGLDWVGSAPNSCFSCPHYGTLTPLVSHKPEQVILPFQSLRLLEAANPADFIQAQVPCMK